MAVPVPGRGEGEGPRRRWPNVFTPGSPRDILATALHLLGIDPCATAADPLGRPVPVAGSGAVRPELPG
jgi:hypothetical protein